MDEAILHIAALVRKAGRPLEANALAAVIRTCNEGVSDVSDHVSKKRLYPWFLRCRRADPDYWHARGIDPETERLVAATLQMKPRRTASGVAPITVITKPWKCAGNCVFCPSDIRMPKSYLHDEPACQRAERNFFDPYLQVASRLRALREMGHPTDKVELIVLGGTWCDYPEGYRLWFAARLFEALNAFDADGEPGAQMRRSDAYAAELRKHYLAVGIANDSEELAERTRSVQARIECGALSYNDAWDEVYGASSGWSALANLQTADRARLERAQRANETAAHRCVGLVVETRPGTLDVQQLIDLRRIGCTKVQVGVQSLQSRVMQACGRTLHEADLTRAFALLRLFGFKIHAHFMANLPGSTPAADIADYRSFAADPRWLPDEVKLYPTVLVPGSRLKALHEAGAWMPYDEDALVNVLAEDVFATPDFMRISRMIRDFSASDIAAGCRKTNLRQMVEQRVRELAASAGADADADDDGAGGEGSAHEEGFQAEGEAGESSATGAAVAGHAHADALAGGASEEDVDDDVSAAARTGASAIVRNGANDSHANEGETADTEAGSRRRIVREIRMREIGTAQMQPRDFHMEEIRYQTSISDEVFLQWVDEGYRIAGFLRLSLPHAGALERLSRACDAARTDAEGRTAPAHTDVASTFGTFGTSIPAEHAEAASTFDAVPPSERTEAASAFDTFGMLPVEGEAMIREVHVYGHAAALHRTSKGAQHLGLGRQLVDRACAIAAAEGYTAVNVISAVGTREYYRHLGFEDGPLYQKRPLAP